jgi:8-amino-7-oxononanoate synthase
MAPEDLVALQPAQLGVSGRLQANFRVEALPSAVEVETGSGRWLNVASDDLLGLGTDPRVKEALLSAARKVGLGRPVQSHLRDELQDRLQATLGHRCAVVGALGSTLQAVPSWRFAVDARSRGLVPEAPSVNSADEAEPLLSEQGLLGVVVEVVHPREGDLAPLLSYAEACQRAGGTLVAVDLLGLGTLGAGGAGACEHLGLVGPEALRLSALGVGLPGRGVVLWGPAGLVAELEAQLEPPLLAPLGATTKALEILAAEPHRRARALDVAGQLLGGLRQLGLDTGPCVTPWIPVWIGSADLARAWLGALGEAGLAARAWLGPGNSRLLLSMAATASDDQVGQALEVLGRTARKVGLVLTPRPATSPLLARPGSFATGTACAPHWFSHAAEPGQTEEAEPGPEHPLRDRLLDAVETVTWRASNASGRTLRRTAEALRALLGRRRG